MMTRLWKTTKKYNRDARIEEHTYSNGEKHYSFRDRLGRPFDIEASEVTGLLKMWKMEEVDLNR